MVGGLGVFVISDEKKRKEREKHIVQSRIHSAAMWYRNVNSSFEIQTKQKSLKRAN